jgi:preprotein translocase subunit SecG
MVYSALFIVALLAVICLPLVTVVIVRSGNGTDHGRDR